MIEQKIFEYVPSDHKNFGTLIVRIPNRRDMHIYTTNVDDVERHMMEIIEYYRKLVIDMTEQSIDIKQQIGINDEYTWLRNYSKKED